MWAPPTPRASRRRSLDGEPRATPHGVRHEREQDDVRAPLRRPGEAGGVLQLAEYDIECNSQVVDLIAGALGAAVGEIDDVSQEELDHQHSVDSIAEFLAAPPLPILSKMDKIAREVLRTEPARVQRLRSPHLPGRPRQERAVPLRLYGGRRYGVVERQQRRSQGQRLVDGERRRRPPDHRANGPRRRGHCRGEAWPSFSTEGALEGGDAAAAT